MEIVISSQETEVVLTMVFFFFQIKFIVLKGQSLSYTLRLPVSKRGNKSMTSTNQT